MRTSTNEPSLIQQGLGLYVGHWAKQLVVYALIFLLVTLSAVTLDLQYHTSRTAIFSFVVATTLLLVVLVPMMVIFLEKYVVEDVRRQLTEIQQLGSELSRTVLLILRYRRYDSRRKLLLEQCEYDSALNFQLSLSAQNTSTIREIEELHRKFYEEVRESADFQIRVLSLNDHDLHSQRLKRRTYLVFLNHEISAELLPKSQDNELSVIYQFVKLLLESEEQADKLRSHPELKGSTFIEGFNVGFDQAANELFNFIVKRLNQLDKPYVSFPDDTERPITRR